MGALAESERDKKIKKKDRKGTYGNSVLTGGNRNRKPAQDQEENSGNDITRNRDSGLSRQQDSVKGKKKGLNGKNGETSPQP